MPAGIESFMLSVKRMLAEKYDWSHKSRFVTTDGP